MKIPNELRQLFIEWKGTDEGLEQWVRNRLDGKGKVCGKSYDSMIVYLKKRVGKYKWEDNDNDRTYPLPY